MKFKAIVEYEYPIEHKPPVKAEIVLHGDRVITDNIKTIEQQPCDCISREAVEEITWEEPTWCDPLNILSEVRDKIRQLPSVTPQPRVGHWEMPVQDDGTSDPIYYQVRCSNCGFDLDPQTWHVELHQYGADKYCPHCGARMEAEE